uniref:3-ketoacyl-[acyl-carrier-protein] reductase beta subunit n=1 Tax=Pavo cristatus TaxID=9049 RepID=A0A8C9FGN7_PAVCR
MGKVCAIFGGSRGIGKAVAELLARKGCRLAIIARNLEVAQTTARGLGAGHLALSCDVSREQEVQCAFEEIQRNLGPINYLVNAAGINRDGLLLRTKTEDMLSQIHTNLLGTMLTCKAAVKSMIHHQGGAIVNIGSVVGLKGNSGQSIYSASKAGIVGFSRSLAKEVARKQIRVNVVAPETLKTIRSCLENIPVSPFSKQRWCGKKVYEDGFTRQSVPGKAPPLRKSLVCLF